MSVITTCLFSLIQNFSKLNHEALLEFIVKREPSLLLEAAQSVQEPIPEIWMIEVIRSIQKTEYVSAIKQVRQSTGMGLKEAKDVVDTLKNGIEVADMSGNSQAAVRQFMAAKLSAAIAPALAKPVPPIDCVHIVRECQNNSIYGVYSTRQIAESIMDRIDCPDDYYVSSHNIR